MSSFNPELGQALFGNPTGSYALPEYVEALFFHILSEISRVYWNLNQESWSCRYTSDPGIPGLTVRPYYWGEDEDESVKPNFVFSDVEIRWYKYTGRGMSCSHELTEKEWVKWFDACIKVIRDYEDSARHR